MNSFIPLDTPLQLLLELAQDVDNDSLAQKIEPFAPRSSSGSVIATELLESAKDLAALTSCASKYEDIIQDVLLSSPGWRHNTPEMLNDAVDLEFISVVYIILATTQSGDRWMLGRALAILVLATKRGGWKHAASLLSLMTWANSQARSIGNLGVPAGELAFGMVICLDILSRVGAYTLLQESQKSSIVVESRREMKYFTRDLRRAFDVVVESFSPNAIEKFIENQEAELVRCLSSEAEMFFEASIGE